MENISQIYASENIASWPQPIVETENRKNRKKRPYVRTADRFNHLTRMVADNHKTLEEDNAAFRLCVYLKNENVLMEVISRNELTRAGGLFFRNITEAALDRIVGRIHNRTGLVVDYQA